MMLRFRIIHLIAAICVLNLLLPCSAQTSMSSASKELGYKGNVENGIEWFAATYHIPVVAECINSATPVTVPPGEMDAASALTTLLSGSSLQWGTEGGVVHIYDPRILAAKNNFLSYRFHWFKVPADPSAFSNQLVDRLAAEWDRDESSLQVIPSAGSDIIGGSTFGTAKCKSGIFWDKTVRNLLETEAAAAQFVTIVIYPNSRNLVTKASWKYVARHWFWRSVNLPYAQVTSNK